MKRWAGGNPGNPDNVHARARTQARTYTRAGARPPGVAHIGSSVDTYVRSLRVRHVDEGEEDGGTRTADAYPDPSIALGLVVERR